MFKEGDKIVCINNLELISYKYNLTNYKIYVILFINHTKTHITILDDNDNYIFCNINRFISLLKYRKFKINKIKNEISSRR